jgi:multiple sugar transport system substrate-binding protein
MAKDLATVRISRRQLLVGAAATGGAALLVACSSPAAPAATQAPAAAAAKKFAGTTIKLMINTIAYADGLVAYTPDLLDKTGIKLEVDALAFANLNTKADLELSTGSGAYDVLQMIYIRSGRWIQAGWAEPLDGYMTADEKKDVEDFALGCRAPFTYDGKIYALPWLADATVVGYRKDIFEKAGYSKFPATFDEFQAAAAKIHTPQTAAFVTQNNLHWVWPNWLISYGGNFFKDPPKDLTPVLNSPEAIKTAEMFTTLIAKYAPSGAGAIDPLAAISTMQNGKAACYLDGMGNVQQIISAGDFKSQMMFQEIPTGPKGYCPQLAVHGLLVNPKGKNKAAAWEVVKWATSKEMMLKMAIEKNHIANTRLSTLQNPDVKKRYTFNGVDLMALQEAVSKQAGTGYMAYRTVPQFPPVGDRVIIAMTSIISGQASVADAMKSLQTDVIGILQKEGVKINP